MNMDELLNIVITCVILSSVLPGLPESPSFMARRFTNCKFNKV